MAETNIKITIAVKGLIDAFEKMDFACTQKLLSYMAFKRSKSS